MTGREQALREHGNAYNIFTLVLTVFSLAIMVLLLVPWFSEDTKYLLRVYDNAICLIFLADFAYNLLGSKPKRAYFLHQRGWLDLLGSIPSLGFFELTALLRLARLSRLARIARMLSGKNRKALVSDVLRNRGQYAAFITLLSAGVVLSVASVVVLQAESTSPDANIKRGGDALWWGLVTITTVGYGDRFPVTPIGRITGMFVMLAGVGIIGALASILASILVPPAQADAEADMESGEAGDATAPAGTTRVVAGGVTNEAIVAELASLRAEVAALREAIRSTS